MVWAACFGQGVSAKFFHAMSKFLGVKDPFDDPFFTQPFGSMFEVKSPFNDPFFTLPFGSQGGPKKEILIEELNPDDDSSKNCVPSKEVIIKNPSANSDEAKTFSFQRVSYGGVNGTYYSSSIGRRTGGDGVVMLEIKEEDKTAGKALHTLSRGIHEKGHSSTTRRDRDGREDSMQILHNLNEDELTNFEEAWRVNADKHLPGWKDGLNLLENTGASDNGWDKLATWGGLALPWIENSGNAEAVEPDEAVSVSSQGRAKKIVRINVE